MNPRTPAPIRRSLVAACIALLAFGTGSETVRAQASGDDPQTEILTRGPVHEAFAGVVSFDPVPGVVVDREPPEPIEEIPPAERPAGDNIALDSGLLGMGRRAERLPLDQRDVAGTAARPRVDRRLLEPHHRRLPMDFRVLGGCLDAGNHLSSGTAGNRRGRPECRPPVTGPYVGARQLDLARRTLCLAPRLLGSREAGLGLGAGPLYLDPEGLHFCGRLLGLHGFPAWRAIRAGAFQPGFYAYGGYRYTPAVAIDLAVFLEHLVPQATLSPLLFRGLLCAGLL